MTENDDLKERVQSNPEENSGASEEQAGKDSSPSKFDAAKAFFRALNAGSEGGETAPPDTGCPSCDQSIGRLQEAEKRSKEYENLYKRMAADFENFRRRMEREKEEVASQGMRRVVESLLPALDDIDRAKLMLNKDMPSDKLLENLHLVINRLHQSLDIVGIQPIDVLGKPFDPKLHEPVQQIETHELPDGHIIHELRKGYCLEGKVIRPALVNVAANPGTKDKESCQESSSENCDDLVDAISESNDSDLLDIQNKQDEENEEISLNTSNSKAHKKGNSHKKVEEKVFDLSDFENMSDIETDLGENF